MIVEIKDLYKSYENGRIKALNGVNLTIEEGEFVSIIGPSGSGKSTLINLIPRLYDVTAGSVTFDDVDVRKLDLSFLRKNIGIVSQETYLFNGTIRENLLYAKPDATETGFSVEPYWGIGRKQSVQSHIKSK